MFLITKQLIKRLPLRFSRLIYPSVCLPDAVDSDIGLLDESIHSDFTMSELDFGPSLPKINLGDGLHKVSIPITSLYQGILLTGAVNRGKCWLCVDIALQFMRKGYGVISMEPRTGPITPYATVAKSWNRPLKQFLLHVKSINDLPDNLELGPLIDEGAVITLDYDGLPSLDEQVLVYTHFWDQLIPALHSRVGQNAPPLLLHFTEDIYRFEDLSEFQAKWAEYLNLAAMANVVVVLSLHRVSDAEHWSNALRRPLSDWGLYINFDEPDFKPRLNIGSYRINLENCYGQEYRARTKDVLYADKPETILASPHLA